MSDENRCWVRGCVGSEFSSPIAVFCLGHEMEWDRTPEQASVVLARPYSSVAHEAALEVFRERAEAALSAQGKSMRGARQSAGNGLNSREVGSGKAGVAA